SGTVKFSDGTPVNFGNVVFCNETHSYYGTIKSDGTYITGGVKEVEGIPDGTYKIYLAATEEVENIYGTPRGIEELIDYKVTQRVAAKYRSYETTDLSFEVKPGCPKTYDIVVEKP
ncbi:MAG: hypothetical protein LBU65_08495, partial [Planctomycetaceae bacterium]|nr:hypothetical protein [Planctomycetaceae bacterium]